MEEGKLNQKTERTPRRSSLQVRLNLLVVCSILLVAAGLTAISYYVFCQSVNDKYDSRIRRAAEACANNVSYAELSNFWSNINTEEFRAVRKRAAASGDESLIEEWLAARPSWVEVYPEEELTEQDLIDQYEDLQGVPEESLTLLDDYRDMLDSLLAIKQYFETDAAYYQYCEGSTTYTLADIDEGFFIIGEIEEPIEAFADYLGNVAVDPLVYRSSFGWLLTAIEPVINPETGEAVATGGVDINMTDIMKERYSFLTQSVAFVGVLLTAAILFSILVLRRTAVLPLRQLSDAATSFAKEDRAFTKDDVIDLDIRSNDEIGELYREIRSMEERIVDYTEHLTQATAEKERVSTELRTASQIQAAMLPSIFPAFPDREDFDLYASMTPAKEVGGDFYDFFLIDDKHLAVLIADVSDKGVPAALFMMASKILINYRAQMGGSPSEILSAVNAQISRSNKRKMFVTVWMGILDLETGLLQCSNAGHEYPCLRGRDGVFRVLKDKHGLVVGAMAKSKYRDYEIRMQPGDAVFVYTDGVPEANNADGAFYGMERMEKTLNTLADQSPRQILEGVKADVDAFTGDARQFDDLTMLCLEYKGSI